MEMERAKNSAKRFFKRLLIWLTVFLIVGTAGYLTFSRYAAFSDGIRVGKIIKFSRKGFVVKTHEGQLNLGGFRTEDDGDMAANVWAFSVYPGDEEVQAAIQEAMEKDYEVKLHYKQRYIKIFFWGDTEYFVDEVEVVNE